MSELVSTLAARMAEIAARYNQVETYNHEPDKTADITPVKQTMEDIMTKISSKYNQSSYGRRLVLEHPSNFLQTPIAPANNLNFRMGIIAARHKQ